MLLFIKFCFEGPKGKLVCFSSFKSHGIVSYKPFVQIVQNMEQNALTLQYIERKEEIIGAAVLHFLAFINIF